MNRKNSMGSEVVPGFACKPTTTDPEKPIMFSAAQIFICDDDRCRQDASDSLAGRVRALIKESGRHCGENRIKVTRTFCNGCCRYRRFAYVYKNGAHPGWTPESSFTAYREVHRWSDAHWKTLIEAILDNSDPELLQPFKVESRVYQASELSRHP